MKNIRIVIGGNFGDEGKGLMSAYFAEEMMQKSGKCLVVLSNGGAQRGHTVKRGELRHVFRHFGSGTFAGADSYYPQPFIVNPMIFMEEYRELISRFPAFRETKLYIHPACRVTTPFEMITNLILEENRGKSRHGSVGVGIWETVIGEGKLYGELCSMSEQELTDYLKEDRPEHMKRRLLSQGIEKIPEGWQEIIQDPGLIRRYIEDLWKMRERVQTADDGILKEYQDIIFENGQGLLLDREMIRKGYGHHTTPSHTGVRNAALMLRELTGSGKEKMVIEAVYVTRSYMTRHGAGRFDTECAAEKICPGMQDLTNQPNASQGTLRYGTLNMRSFLRRAQRDYHMLRDAFDGQDGRIQTDWAVAVTHLNEYFHPGTKAKKVKYKSFAEEGPECVIL